MKLNSNKFLFAFILISLTISFIYSFNKSNLKKSEVKNNKSKNNSKGIDLIGESYSQGSVIHPSVAVTSAEGIVFKTPASVSGYSNAEIVNKLQEEVALPAKGPLEAIEEVPTQVNYYNGDLNLNSININCSIFSSLDSCIKTNKCGWCSSNNQCMFGNSMSPELPCPKSMLLFSTSADNTLKIFNDNSLGRLTHTTILGS